MFGIVFVVALLLLAAGVVEWARGERAGAQVEAGLVGTWVLTGVDRDGQAVITATDLSGSRISLTFDARGTVVVGDCGGTTGDYHVRWDHLSIDHTVSGALACGHATAAAERTGTTVGVAVNAVVERGADVAFPAAGRVTLTVGHDVLHYAR